MSPTGESVALFWRWMREFRLGRNRMPDTMPASTYFAHQVNKPLSSNAPDFGVFGCFHVITPA